MREQGAEEKKRENNNENKETQQHLHLATCDIIGPHVGSSELLRIISLMDQPYMNQNDHQPIVYWWLLLCINDIID